MSATAPSIDVCRVHDAESAAGARLLVDRLWPRGVSKATLRLDEWIRDAAPSEELRRWFNHEPAKWHAFRKRYIVELDMNPQAVARCLEWCAKGPMTLLFAAHDIEHNNAIVLRDYLIGQGQKDRHCTTR
uniref:DUF488 domain-containing protein n=1 Tax=Pararhizobium sp. IMCC3301 TaxID=3067904 RepID=UPI002742928B|nr:DUF488 family protein [Pararhizobium sp. IMCC3301]